MGIPFAGEDHYSTLVLIHEGVPAQAIRALEPPIDFRHDKSSHAPRHSWRSTSDALDVMREVLGLLNARAGLPLHPAR
jgi:hypothetical protein